MAKIVLTVHQLGQGGTDRVCAHLAHGFVAAGYAVEVVALADAGGGAAALLPLFGERVRLTFLGAATGRRPLDMAVRAPALVRRLRGARPDLVLSTGNNMNWLTALAVRRARLGATRLALKTTNPIVRPQDPWWRRGVRQRGYARAFAAADRVLTLSDEETEALRTAFPAAADRFVTVANPYVTDRMLTVAPAPAGPVRTILAAGRLAAQKRMDLAVRAFARLDRADARLVVLGEGPDRAALEALAAELGVADRVAFPGFTADVTGYYAAADLFVLPSRYEGLPAVVLEAMAVGVPVVATDCFPAARSLIRRAPGCAIAEPTPDAFAAAMAAALDRPRPAGLREVAAPYGIAAAVTSHLRALAPLIAGS